LVYYRRKLQGKILNQGLRDKLKNDEDFRNSYSKSMSKIANRPKNIERVRQLGKRARGTEADKAGRIIAAKTNKSRAHKRDRCSCIFCKKETSINTLYQHGENRCTGDKSLMKDSSGNKGNYIRIRASCKFCRQEMIISKIEPHIRAKHDK
jgi:hypothetical protein